MQFQPLLVALINHQCQMSFKGLNCYYTEYFANIEETIGPVEFNWIALDCLNIY